VVGAVVVEDVVGVGVGSGVDVLDTVVDVLLLVVLVVLGVGVDSLVVDVVEGPAGAGVDSLAEGVGVAAGSLVSVAVFGAGVSAVVSAAVGPLEARAAMLLSAADIFN
jgi:hypothetical protein